MTHICVVIDGYVIGSLTQRLNIAGRHITDYFFDLLQARGYDFNRQADFDTVREIKEKLCYVAYDIEKENKLGAETTVLVEKYKLPDGKIINVNFMHYIRYTICIYKQKVYCMN